MTTARVNVINGQKRKRDRAERAARAKRISEHLSHVLDKTVS